LPRSLSSVDAAAQQRRPTIDGFMGREQVPETMKAFQNQVGWKSDAHRPHAMGLPVQAGPSLALLSALPAAKTESFFASFVEPQ